MTTTDNAAGDAGPDSETVEFVNQLALVMQYDGYEAAARLIDAHTADLRQQLAQAKAALLIRERQLRIAVAGMSQGKDASIFVAIDQAGRIFDVVTKAMEQSTGSDTIPDIRELAPIPVAALAPQEQEHPHG